MKKTIINLSLSVEMIIYMNFGLAGDNPFRDGYHQDTNPYGEGYIQETNPYREGYVQDKRIFEENLR